MAEGNGSVAALGIRVAEVEADLRQFMMDEVRAARSEMRAMGSEVAALSVIVHELARDVRACLEISRNTGRAVDEFLSEDRDDD